MGSSIWRTPNCPSYEIFRDADLRAQFTRDGFVTLPWLDAAALAELRALFEDVRGKVNLKGFATTTTSPDIALKQDMFARIAPMYQEKLDAVFQDYKSLGVSFLQKDAGAAGSLPLHQDWTVTDEDWFRTLTIWIPLEDCGVENGALQMLAGSHRFMNLLRGPNLPIAIRAIAPQLESRLVTLTLRAGEAVIFDHSLLHKSLLNTSDRPRIAVTYGLTQRATPLRFWYHHPTDPADRLEQIAVPDDFFLQYHQIGQRPTIGQSLGFYRHDLSPLTQEDCAALGEGRQLYRPIFRDFSTHACVRDAPQYAITHNPDWNRELAQQGYVQFPLLGSAEVAALKAFFEAHQTAPVDRFYASVHNPDSAYRLKMDAEIQRIVRPRLDALLADAVGLGGSFIAKPPGNAGILPPHADWNIVDERFFRSYNLWIPLVDTTVENGAVHVIPGSHNWLDYFRGPGIENPFAAHKDAIWKAMQPLEMRAGTALLYDHRLLHASPVNRTDGLRLACVMGIQPKAAEMRYYHGEGNLVREYVAHAAFFMLENPERGPANLQLLGEVTDQAVRISADALRQFLGWEAEAAEVAEVPATPVQRGFWQTYTPRNILRELRHRIFRN